MANLDHIFGTARTLHQVLFFGATQAFAAMWFLSPDLADDLSALVLLLFLAGLPLRAVRLPLDLLTILIALLATTIVSGYLWQKATVPPELFGGSSARDYVYCFALFLLVAHGAQAWEERAPHFLLLSACLGLLLHLVFQAPSEDWWLARSGERVAFGFQNAQHTGVLFGTGLIAALSFTPRAVRSLQGVAARATALAGGCLVLLMAWGCLVSQTRAVWLGLLVALVVACGAALLLRPARTTANRATQPRRKTLASIVAAGVLAAAALVLWAPHALMEDRLEEEVISIESISEAAQLELGPLSSSGVRIASWRASLDWIAQRPLLGWGGYSVARLIDGSPHFSPAFKASFGHLHNSYLESLVATGLIPTLLMLAIIMVVGRRSLDAWRQGHMPQDAFLFAISFFAFWATANMFESYMKSETGFYVNAVIGGFVYCFHLRARAAAQAA